MILFLTLEVTEWIITAISTRWNNSNTGKGQSSTLVANGLAVWGVSSDMGDADSIPWSKPGRIKIWACISCPLGDCPNYWIICYFWRSCSSSFSRSVIVRVILNVLQVKRFCLNCITVIIFTSLPEPFNCLRWNLKRSCIVLILGCHLYIQAYIASKASKCRCIKVAFKPILRN